MLRWLEQTGGLLLIGLVVLDVFLTVLYPRLGTGVLAPRLARMTWWLFLRVSRPLGERRRDVMSFCGPVILGVLVLVWGLGLTLGTALVIHPVLGTSVRASSGPTPTDFITAMYAGGSSVAIVGASNFTPQTGAFRFFYLLNSLVGMSVLSLTLTYLMQIYSALHRRNALGLRIHLFSARSGDAAELLARLGPRGRFQGGYSNLSELSGAVAELKEIHHFYPVLFFFRLPETYYAVSAITSVSLDTVALILSALDGREYGWLRESSAVVELWEASMLTVTSLVGTFLSADAARPGPPGAEARERWRRRYFAALRRLRQAGIQTVEDEEAGASRYVALRAQWDELVGELASSMAYDREDFDPAGTHPEWTVRPPPAAARERGSSPPYGAHDDAGPLH